MRTIFQLLKLLFQTGQFVLVHSVHKIQPYKDHKLGVSKIIFIMKHNCAYCSLISVYSSDFPISVSLASSVSEKFKGTSIYFSSMRTELHQENDKDKWKVK